MPRIVAISLTKAFVSLVPVDWERSKLNLARRHGCLETWTLDGSVEAIGEPENQVRESLMFTI